MAEYWLMLETVATFKAKINIDNQLEWSATITHLPLNIQERLPFFGLDFKTQIFP